MCAAVRRLCHGRLDAAEGKRPAPLCGSPWPSDAHSSSAPRPTSATRAEADARCAPAGACATRREGADRLDFTRLSRGHAARLRDGDLVRRLDLPQKHVDTRQRQHRSPSPKMNRLRPTSSGRSGGAGQQTQRLRPRPSPGPRADVPPELRSRKTPPSPGASRPAVWQMQGPALWAPNTLVGFITSSFCRRARRKAASALTTG